MDTELNLSGMEEADYIAALLLKQLRQEITEVELEYLESWKAAHPSHAHVAEQINDGEQLLADLQSMKQIDMDGWWQKISAQIPQINKTVPFYRRWYAYAAAAAVLLVAGAITWQYRQPARLPEPANEKYLPAVVDVKPGGNKATLTLSNGTAINLADAAIGNLAKEGGMDVLKVKDGELKYERAGTAAINKDVVWNTLTTPRGGQYSLLLPDGSKVWLNAASSIKYPAHFSPTERRVIITGEAFFEVAAGKKKWPFTVMIPPRPGGAGGAVEVLGTSFDISAYDDEADIRTTLLNGKVKIAALQLQTGAQSEFKVLSPGQQGRIPYSAVAGKDAVTIVNLEDVEEVSGWKNGLIHLQNADIRSIMRIISRWYNIEVSYEGQTPAYTFTGTLPLKENLSAVIKVLEFEGVRFRMQQNKIIVLPKEQ
jgi:transmembrane sensor